MSYPDQGGSDFQLYTAPPAPATAGQLVDEYGMEAVRAALPEREQRAFDRANPWSNIEEAHREVDQQVADLSDFDTRVQQQIASAQYTPEQADVLFAQTADLRQGLVDNVGHAHGAAQDALNTYQNNLIAHIENRGLTQRVALQLGDYSTAPLNPAEAAARFLPESSRRDRGGPSGGGSDRRAPLAPTSGNRQRRGR